MGKMGQFDEGRRQIGHASQFVMAHVSKPYGQVKILISDCLRLDESNALAQRCLGAAAPRGCNRK